MSVMLLGSLIHISYYYQCYSFTEVDIIHDMIVTGPTITTCYLLLYVL